jgi:hypothetical protein
VLLLKLQRRWSAIVVLVFAAVFGYLSTMGLMAKVMLPPLERAYPDLRDRSPPFWPGKQSGNNGRSGMNTN